MNASYAHRVLRKIGWGIVIALIVLIVGTMIGFGLGGGSPWKVFLPSTWLHITDFLK